MGSRKSMKARAREIFATLLGEGRALSFEELAWHATRRISSEMLAGDVQPKALSGLAEALAQLAEDLAYEGRKISPPPHPIACRAGCGHCCHISVAAAPAEIFRLAEYIRKTFSKAARNDLVVRLRAAAAMTRNERFAGRLPCPLLEDDSCSAYPARPLNCMGLESMDADACRRASHGEIPSIPIYMTRWTLYSRVLAGLVAGAVDAGRGHEQIDLFPALLIALENDDAASRWLSGEPLFARCLWLPD
jgi:hypothetical protein